MPSRRHGVTASRRHAAVPPRRASHADRLTDLSVAVLLQTDGARVCVGVVAAVGGRVSRQSARRPRPHVIATHHHLRHRLLRLVGQRFLQRNDATRDVISRENNRMACINSLTIFFPELRFSLFFPSGRA